MASFMDFLDKHERTLENLSKPKEEIVTRQEVPIKRVVTKQIVETKKPLGNNSFSLCISCGKKQPILLEGTYCPVCGKQSLKSSKTGEIPKKDLSGLYSHAEALLDDDTPSFAEDYVSPLQKLIKAPKETTIEEGREITDHASDLLGDDDSPSVGPAGMPAFIPMPDFSSLMKKQSQTISEQKQIPTEYLNDPRLKLATMHPVAVDPSIEAEMRALGL